MNIVEPKKIIQDLYSKSQSISDDFDKKSTQIQLIQPFFEALGWDFQTDVKTLIDDNIADKAFKIDGVTRFYLKVLPHGTPIESSRKSIESLTSYAYNKGVTWAVATNFKEMRVYNTEAPGSSLAAIQHYSFKESEYVTKFENLGDLTKKQFSLNVLDSEAEYFGKKPKRVPIDKQLLKDLLSFRNLLVTSIIKNNSIKEEDAEQAAQKILNRLIFIRSCGDRKIEERHLKASLADWEQDKSKKLIEYLRKIFAHFNGRYGSTLFEKHQCDSLMIHDGVLEDVINGLYKPKEKAIEYNFAHIEHDSLGKMYENYLGTVQQKKDGAYYTPSYISKYICENTIIPYLSKSDVTTIPDLISEYENNFEELESKIHDIKILDPACGTGEFLIRAVDVLLKISKEIQKKKTSEGYYQTSESSSRKATRSLKKKKSPSVTFQTFDMDIENQELRKIIQNNIHGVDMNEEAIEIAKLNIFLKLATSSRQLLDLSKNLRIGNSLVDDPSVDPKAFDWEKEFPEKFDVIIGNPPYIRMEKFKEIKDYLKKNFETHSERSDIFVYFYELGLNLLKVKGYFGVITSNTFIQTEYGSKLKKFLLEKTLIKKILYLGETQFFEKATTYPLLAFYQKMDTIDKQQKIQYFALRNMRAEEFSQRIKSGWFFIKQKDLDENYWPTTHNVNDQKILKKILTNSISLKQYIGSPFRGIVTGCNDAFIINEKEKYQFIQNDKKNSEIIKPFLKGSDLFRWYTPNSKNSLIYTSKSTNIKLYDDILKHLGKFKSRLLSRATKTNWWQLQQSQLEYVPSFESPKIIYEDIANKPKFSLDSEKRYIVNSVYFLKSGDLFLLCLLNSNLTKWFIYLTSRVYRGGFSTYRNVYVEKIPIKKPSLELEKIIITKALKIIELTKDFHTSNESDKQGFEERILSLENEINHLVYEIYGITDEEKAIIESSI